MLIYDFLNRPLIFKSTPKRIVSLVPSQTELIVDLGLEQKLLGITKFCVHPSRLKSTKTIVGGTKQIHLDKIKSLQPEIILCNKEENTPEMVSDLEKIAPVHVSAIKNLDDNFKLIEDYALIFDCHVKAKTITSKLQTQKDNFINAIKTLEPKKVAYFIWRDPWMTVGGDTFINHMLEVNNFENVFSNQRRYPEIDIHNLPELDLLLLSSEPFPFKTKHLKEIPIPNDKIKFVNGEYFSWYGSRMIKAFEYFRQFHY